MNKQTRILNIALLLAGIFMLNFAVNAQIKVPRLETEKKAQTPAPVIGGRYLFWDRVAVNPTGFTDCLGLGLQTLDGFQNVRQSKSEVSGFYGTNYASISCLNNVAYIVVIGGESNKTKNIRDTLRNRFSNNRLSFPVASTVENNNYLSIVSKQVQSSTERGCLDIAKGAMFSQFRNAQKSASEVTGSNSETYAAIACQQTGSRFTAIVMVVGSDPRRTGQTKERLAQKVATTVLFGDDVELNPVDN